jgi:predicted GH43/DUF377 family glycosyl hydrolase
VIRISPTAALTAVVGLAGCGGYGDFRLPAPAIPPVEGQWSWTQYEAPVLGRSRAEAWESVDTLNPSIVREHGVWWNFYSGYDGRTWHTGLASSPDGLIWTRLGKVLSPDPGTWEGHYIASNGAAIRWGGEWLYFYQGGDPPRIGLARSSDGKTWRKDPAPVLGFGPRGSWDEKAVADPYVLAAGDRLYLYYLGEDRARRQRLGVAVSTDGNRWTKLRASPVLEPGDPGSMDENGLGEPAVWDSHGWYWMLFTGRARNEVRRLGLARSRDGVVWERTALVISGQSAWNRLVVCDPTVHPEGDRVRVWFGGGDVAHPAENIHGQIGYGELAWRASSPSERRGVSPHAEPARLHPPQN